MRGVYTMSDLHKRRVISELKAAGMTSYGLIKIETDRLPRILHVDEHIGGVVYGRTTDDKVGSAMLVATDKRVIFLDAKPFFTTMDEVSYDVVSGVKVSKAGIFSAIVLHTRVRDYGLRFVNKKCAELFKKYIESHIEQSVPTPTEVQAIISDGSVEEYISSHNEAILSTVDREGNVHGRVIHYSYRNDQLYFVTKVETNKYQHIGIHGQVALTIHQTGSLKAARISGLAQTETDKSVVDSVFDEISKPKKYKEGTHLPPIAAMKQGNMIVVRITPTNIVYDDFSTNSW